MNQALPIQAIRADDPAAHSQAPPAVISAIRQSAVRTPEAVALRGPDSVLTYRQMMRRVDGLAATLRERGVGPGHQVAVHLPRSPEMIIAMLGVLACGAAYVPLDPANPAARLQHILNDSGSVLLLSERNGQGLADAVGIPCLCPSDWRGESPALPAPHDGPAYLIYTSGSTGLPKGVLIEHSSLENYLAWALAELPFTGRGVPLLASISFDHSVTCCFPPLMKGEPLSLMPPLEGGRAMAKALLDGRRYSYVKITPSHARLLDLEQRAALGRCTDLLMFGGERVTADLIEQVRRDAPALPVMNHYGPTEATVGCCVYRVPSGPVEGVVPIGQPIPGVSAMVLRPDGVSAQPGETGELYIGGKALAQGYYRRPELTARAFVELAGLGGRWYRTGDVARLRGDGLIEYLGRADDQIKVLGHRIEPAEIEAALRRHKLVGEAAVVAREREDQIELIAAITAADVAPQEEALRAHLRLHLPAVMVPSRLLFFDRLPVTAGGKIDRQAILARAAATPAPVTASVEGLESPPAADEPRARPALRDGAMECWLAARFATVLGVTEVGLDDDFFELGGDSLATVEIIQWVRDELQAPVEAPALFKYPTVRMLVAHLRTLRSPGSGSTEPQEDQ